jgi:biopolymer transport protein ExbB/TolQ
VRKPLKIFLITLLLLLVVFSIIADLPIGQKLQKGIALGAYLKWVSLLGLIIAAFTAWGYRNQVVASQKYRRADEAVAKAEETYERKKKACEQMEERLRKAYEEKTKGVDNQIDEVRRAYKKRLKELKEQNMELKETVGKLMRTLKQERQQRS